MKINLLIKSPFILVSNLIYFVHNFVSNVIWLLRLRLIMRKVSVTIVFLVVPLTKQVCLIMGEIKDGRE